MSRRDLAAGVVNTVLASAVMIVLAVIGFFVSVFVIDQGAALAGYTVLNGDYVILSASLLVASTIIAGSLS